MNPLKPYFYGAIVIAFVGLLGYAGWLYYDRDTYMDKATTEESKKNLALQTITTMQESATADRKLLEGYQSVKTEIQVVDKIVTKEIIRYRDRVIDRCTLSPEWVSIHNTSTDSQDTASGIDDQTPGAAEATN